jgi:hypothetical protein
MVLSLPLILLLPLWAEPTSTKPDFSGTWRLDPLRSRSEQVTQPKEMVLKIEHHEPAIRIEILRDLTGGKSSEVFNLKTDGNPVQIDASAANTRWDDWKQDRLIIEVERRTPIGLVKTVREIRLGDKGKTLTTILTARDGSGEKKAYEFYVRE